MECVAARACAPNVGEDDLHCHDRTTRPGTDRFAGEASETSFITGNGYHVRVVPPHGPLLHQTRQLVGRMYASRGLKIDMHATHRAPPPHELTLAACRGDTVFGTLTVRIDRGSGLLADELYRDEIDLVRADGRTVCEVGRLAMDHAHTTPDALRRLFQLAFRVAHNGHGYTDSFIEVHPRHARFYAGKLGYRLAGKPATCPRVNAPAVLMHLPLATAEHATLLTPERQRHSIHQVPRHRENVSSLGYHAGYHRIARLA